LTAGAATLSKLMAPEWCRPGPDATHQLTPKPQRQPRVRPSRCQPAPDAISLPESTPATDVTPGPDATHQLTPKPQRQPRVRPSRCQSAPDATSTLDSTPALDDTAVGKGNYCIYCMLVMLV